MTIPSGPLSRKDRIAQENTDLPAPNSRFGFTSSNQTENDRYSLNENEGVRSSYGNVSDQAPVSQPNSGAFGNNVTSLSLPEPEQAESFTETNSLVIDTNDSLDNFNWGDDQNENSNNSQGLGFNMGSFAYADEEITVSPTPRSKSEAQVETFDGNIEVKDKTLETSLDINVLLNILLDNKGSDLHLSARNYPMIRVHGEMKPVKDFGILSGNDIKTAAYNMLTSQQKDRFEEAWELDLAYNLPGRSRFRVNLMKQRGEVTAVLRAIPWEIKTVEELGLPEVIKTWATLPRGLVLITGPTGSGKSTTLASIIDYANRTRAGHIVTIEDPIEFVHAHQLSVVNQREVGEDTHSFADALKHVLRQDPDIILVGELRDLETISVAITAAETGHLVFGTLHTQSAEETISRIIDVFPEGGQQQIRTQLATTLQGVACQTLLKTTDGNGRVAATEIMIANSAVRALIRDGKTHQIKSTIESGAKYGMQTLDKILKDLVEDGTVRWQDAAEKSSNYDEFIHSLGGERGLQNLERRLNGGGFKLNG